MTAHARKAERNAEIRQLFADGTPIAELAKWFAVSRARIYQITGRVTQRPSRERSVPTTPALQQARAILAAEIKAAREEAATAPLYRSGPR